MKFLIILYAYGILKVVDPAPGDPLYLLVDPVCKAVDGYVTVYVTHQSTDEDPGPVGYLTQGSIRCDVEQLVTEGP